MYLNKTAERTEEIISVPHIIEMSCRITQRRQTGMHSSKQQRCHWHLLLLLLLFLLLSFPFANYRIAKSSRCNEEELHEDQRIVCLSFNESERMADKVWMLTWEYRRTGLLGGKKKWTTWHKKKPTRGGGCCFVKHGEIISWSSSEELAFLLHPCMIPCAASSA